jgi:type II secretory pathway pseudopilin PulG
MIEMIVAIAISSAIGGGILFSIYQTSSYQAMDKARMNCVKQLENAIHYIVQDAQMAQKIEPDADADGFPLTLSWVEWDNTQNEVTYSITNNELKRSYSINSGDPVENILARYIETDSAKTNCGYVGGALNVELTATITGFPKEISETRDIEIIRRTDW